MRSLVHMIETTGNSSTTKQVAHEKELLKNHILECECELRREKKARRPVLDDASICLIFYFSFVLRAKKKSSEHILLF